MAKKKTGKPRRELTRRQHSHWQQQRRRQLIILAAGIFIIVAVIGITGVGWFTTQYQPLHQTVIKVNATRFTMDYYLKMMKYYGKDAPAQYMSFLAGQLVTVIQQNELMRQGTAELGITIDDKTVNEELKNRKPPLSKDYRDIVRAELLINKLRDDHFDKEVPTSGEQRQVMAMFLESEGLAAQVRARVEAGDDFGALASQYSLDDYTRGQKGDVGWHPKGILPAFLGSSTVEDYAFGSEAGVLSQPRLDETKTKKAGYWLIKVLERRDDLKQAHVQGILLGNADEAQAVKARLDAGEDFTTLAKELTQFQTAQENGGDLGWLSPGTRNSAFDQFAFEGPLDTLSSLIRDDTVDTAGGYWLIKVVAKEDNRQIDDEDRNILKNNAMREWLASLWADPANKVENLLDDAKMSWAIARVTKELGK